MGNTAALAYDIDEQIEFRNKINWTLHHAHKKYEREEQKENVSLFRVSKANNSDLVLVQRAIQKLRTLKHPFVLKFVETAEMDDSIALVTEPCVPLETWIGTALESRRHDQQDKEDGEVMLQEIMWGLKCILLAMKFFHENCLLLHGNLGLHSIFVTPNGDWKLGGLELACNVGIPGDLDHFCKYAHLLDDVYCSPERSQREALTAKSPPYYVDMYAFGQCVQRAFNAMDLDMPRAYGKYLTSMLHADMKRRPTPQKLLESSMFSSEHLALVESIGELALKEPKEFLELVAKVEPKLQGLSRAVCAHKILPNLARTLQIAINDFPLRDAREGCRQSIQVSVNVLAKLASLGKIDASVFRQSWVPILVQLWAMQDRAVRTVMLQTLQALVPFIPDAIINRSVFDSVLGGFADDNAKLRESTLRNVFFLVDKLEEPQLQDRLVRAITNLQNDPDSSIRTNATIFLGRIATRLKEPVRVRVLCVSFQKAMKDNFPHCRVAGLRTANACVKLLDIPQVASKIVPQASILLLDKAAEVRSLALTLIEACLQELRAHHEALLDKARSEGGSGSANASSSALNLLGSPHGSSLSSNRMYADSPSTLPGKNLGGPADSAGTAERGGSAAAAPSAWSSWSVLQGLSKTLESATLAATEHSAVPPAQQPEPRRESQHASANPAAQRLFGASGAGGARPAPAHRATSDELSLDPDVFRDDEDSVAGRVGAVAGGGSGTQPRGGGWDDADDLDLDLDLDDDNEQQEKPEKGRAAQRSGAAKAGQPVVPPVRTPAPAATLGLARKEAATASAALAPAAPTGMKLGAGKASGSAKVPKVAVTKLSVNKDEGWEDF